jgi:hypothetical protein
MPRRSIFGIGALLLCFAVLAGPASAAKKLVFKTTFFPDPPDPAGGQLFILKDSPTDYLISGGVDSKNPECEFRRTIRLHVIHANNTDTVIAAKKTKRSGLFNFRVPLTPREGVYASTPARQFVTESGKRVHCATGRTPPQYPT